MWCKYNWKLYFIKLKLNQILKLNVNTNFVNFGTIVIGEKLNRKVQLINKGALGTKFKIISSVSRDNNSANDEGIQLGDVNIFNLTQTNYLSYICFNSR